jgi:two-component system NtrC family sensor kinase
MRVNLKTKIWLTICSIVLIFSFFTLLYFPRQQGNLLINDYNTEVQNLANTVALGVKIAITEQDFEGVQTAIEFVKGDPRLQFVSMLQFDTVWNTSHSDYIVKKTIFKTFPEEEKPNPGMASNDSIIVKSAPFTTSMMSGAIMLAFNTREIDNSKQKIEAAALAVSCAVFLIGILIGLWLARNISVPVRALRDAAYKVGEGDLSQRIHYLKKDEIGELGQAFNKMVDELDKTRKELSKKNAALSETNETLSRTLLELKNTHLQLLQAEKMASLGELTAGIAHEIQNPLNFVNNFAELNTELIAEIKEELQAGNMPAVLAILEDVRANSAKINHHGRRAESIVKGMLQHSRAGTGAKEMVAVNALAEEYLRLAYQGLRARNKSFQVVLKTAFDPAVGDISVVSQELGRVMLNLITNAFYAVAEKHAASMAAGKPFEPAVSLFTRKLAGQVSIEVWDNGHGIPERVRDKIFQPFFTTKPTGQGTGLGLSLSYEIVKAHGGNIKVDTKEGEYTSFIVNLPV